MKNALKAAAAAAVLATASAAWATPSTTYWTPSTTYTQPYLVPHVTYDTYFGEPGMYGVDTGLTIGVLPFDTVNAEIGFDLLYGSGLMGKQALTLNGKVTLVEGKLASWQPGVSAGIFGVGFETDVTDANVLHATVAKTFPYVGNVGVGVYHGLNDKILVDKDGNPDETGFFLAWTGPEIAVGAPGLKKIVPAADFQSGKNALSAVGGGLYFYFTDAIDLLVGPVFFLEPELQPNGADWLFTAQIDVDFDLRKPKK
ncbi:MAG TPA: hypothetical protein VFL83_00245 [Anaeromyxobacter sp.]|nr:hypothetical protein [Anaeromyxobacter sp.]